MRQGAWVFVAISIATVILRRLSDFVPFVRDNLHLAVGALFLLTAIHFAERRPGGLAHHGLSLGGLLVPDDPPAPNERPAWLPDLAQAVARALPSFARELGVALATCAVVFPPFVLGFYFWHGPEQPFSWQPQRDAAGYLLTQLVIVALPEEALFRGYFQTVLSDGFRQRTRVLGTELSLRALVTQAALFALLHYIVDFQVARLAVFFPALLFGWLAARRGGIGAAIFVHALSNVLSDLLVRGWL